MIGLLVLGFSLITFFNPDNAYGVELALGLAICDVYLAYFIYRKINLLLGIAYLYYSLNCLRIMMFPEMFFKGFGLAETIGFQSLVSEAQFYLMAIALCFTIIRTETLKEIQTFFVYMAFTNAVVLWILFLMGRDEPCFLFNNPALDVAFISCCIPICYDHVKKNLSLWPGSLAMIVLASPCIFTKTSSGILGLGISIAAYFWSKNEFKKKNFMVGFYCLGFMTWLGWFMQGSTFINSNGRIGVWKLALRYFWEDANIWIGTGAGTFRMIGPGLQMAQAVIDGDPHREIPGFFWAHSDPIQVLLETGIIGLVLAIIVLAVACWKLRRSPAIFAGLMTLISLSFIQMPLRWFLFTGLGGLFIFKAFRSPEEFRH